MSRTNLLVVIGAVAMLLAGPASAERLINIHYDTIPPLSAWRTVLPDHEGDNLWDVRDETGNPLFLNEDLAQAYPGENAPELTITVDVNADLDGPGTYEVYVAFASVPGAWGPGAAGVAAAIDAAALVNYDDSNSAEIGLDGPWGLYEAFVGQVTSSTTFDVRIDQFGPQRTMPDYVRIIPEPATLGLSVMGALLMLRRRR